MSAPRPAGPDGRRPKGGTNRLRASRDARPAVAPARSQGVAPRQRGPPR